MLYDDFLKTLSFRDPELALKLQELYEDKLTKMSKYPWKYFKARKWHKKKSLGDRK